MTQALQTAALIVALALPTIAAETNLATSPHVRVLAGNSCGSGTICGQTADGCYVLTNAHVTGTTLGRTVDIDFVAPRAPTRMAGRTIHTGYDDRHMVDYSLVWVPHLNATKPMQLLRARPSTQPLETRGSPRCIWPQQTKPFEQAENYGEGLITGLPNAIGGQSGSAIYDTNHDQIALLTWSLNGRCAGQTTAKLWQVATQANVELADLRPATLEELPYITDRQPTENAIQGTVGNPVAELPIWTDGPGPTTPVDPSPEDDVSHFEKLLDLLSKILDALQRRQ